MKWLITIVVLCGVASATNAVYIGQSAAGANDGTSCANQKAYTYFNTAGNWSATPTGIQIGPDTTVHLCGAIIGDNTVGHTIFVFQGSGTSGHPITMLWETGATVSLPACGTKDAGGCIDGGGNIYLLLDGGSACGFISGADVACNGVVQSTANGTAGTYANQTAAVGLRILNCTGCEIRNLSIQNMYVMVGNDNAPSGFSSDPSAIWFNGSNILIHNNVMNQMNHGVTDLYNNSDTNVKIYNNTINHMNQGTSVGNNNTNAITSFFYYSNHIENMATWDNAADNYHHDGIFFFQDNVSGSITNSYIYDNLFDGDIGANATAWIYHNSGIHGVYVFNNKFFNTAGRGVAMLEGGFTGDTNYFIYNNFIDAGGLGNGSTCFQYGNGGTSITNFTLENNICQNADVDTDFNGVVIGTGTIDHNVWAATSCTSARCFQWNGTGSAFTSWKTNCSCDSHSLNPSSAGVNAIGFPQAGSAAIHDGTNNFIDLTASCSGNLAALCTDYASVVRPANAGSEDWDAGAYQFATLPSPSSAPAGGMFAELK